MRETESEKTRKLYGTKQEICEIFGVKLKTLGTDLTEMRRMPEFSGAILRVGHKRIFISINGYEKYLKWRAAKHQSL
ncbi:MAG: DNA-binding protein [Streptococcaceae bacterium]|jgi:hypothetical protein|nr:DNA-binding protein [Streptococcaceae bacterium]